MIAGRRAAAVVGIAVGALGLLAACGGSKSSYKPPSGAAVATLRLDAGNFFFTPKNPSEPAGIIEIDLKNVSGIQHTLAISGVKGFELKVNSKGSTDGEKVDLKTGTYTFYCTIPGHRGQGMQGKLTVK
ncbi:MAG: plastocyanin [Actinomycetia bacterium]|nr:plastocyanin [Actinomycetes bacterium]